MEGVDKQPGDPKEMSSKELLRECENAIKAIFIGGQEYRIGSRILRRANLTELRNMRKMLKDEVANENSGEVPGYIYQAMFEPRG